MHAIELRRAVFYWGLAILWGLCPASPLLAQSYSFTGPDGKLKATVKVANGDLYYSLANGSQTLVNDSRLGLLIDNNGSAEDTGNSIQSLTVSPVTSVDRTYPTLGWHDTAVDRYNQRTFSIASNGGADNFTIQMRVFTDGVAFRYSVPGSGNRTILGESTEWALPGSANGWYQSGTNGDYANSWVNNSVSTMATASNLMGPVVIHYGPSDGGGYAAITESDYWGYSGMTYIGAGSGTNKIKANFIRDSSWQVPGGSYSPWRTIVVSPDLNGLVNGDMVNNVARPANPSLYPDGVNTSWIEPGRSLWSWLDINGARVNPTNMRAYVDRAQKLGFEYFTVDSGWKNWSDGSKDAFGVMADLTSYAAARGVNIIVWKDSHDFYSGDLTTGTFDTTAMQNFLQQVKDAGASGVKMDFLRKTGHLVGEYQRLLNFMATTYESAAALHLVVDFHGAPKTAGQTISFPNALTTEDLRGMESGANAKHDATLPFTTLLSGPADYTPGVFSPDSNRGKRANTTWAHQMAMGVLITSPIIHWASGPEELDDAMPDGSPALEVFKAIPSTWDETRVLGISDIGNVAAFARRKGTRWFLAMVNGDASNPLTLSNIDLSFLGSGEYDAILLADNLSTDAAWNATTVHGLTQSYDLDVTMRRGGGFVAMFTAVPEPTGIAFAVLLLGAALSRHRSIAPGRADRGALGAPPRQRAQVNPLAIGNS